MSSHLSRLWLLPIFFIGWLFLHEPFMSYAILKQAHLKQLSVPLAPPAAFGELVVSGLIDASNDTTRIPLLQSGILETMNVVVGQKVKKGDLLFSLNSVMPENNVKISQVNLKQAKNELKIQTQSLAHYERQLNRLKSIDRRAISLVELRDKMHEVKMGKIRLRQAKNNVSLAKTNLKNAKVVLEQFRAFAPKDSIVIQINYRVGEYVGGSQTVVVLGDAKKVIVRVSVDERDINRLIPDAPAYFFNNAGEKVFLTYMQQDRLIVLSDRLNSRVQEVLYYYDRDACPDFLSGHQINVQLTSKANV
ncbi:MAG: efflux RND transporter periplasmic adaptor subunit [Gammaproteobacteria bacterium]|nr:efflux RND transporter periplasmic adaptor subunit [Gammaproteobacteria bacterium]